MANRGRSSGLPPTPTETLMRTAAITTDACAVLLGRIAELEAAATKALRHADKNGMGDWPAFAALRKAMAKSTA